MQPVLSAAQSHAEQSVHECEQLSRARVGNARHMQQYTIRLDHQLLRQRTPSSRATPTFAITTITAPARPGRSGRARPQRQLRNAQQRRSETHTFSPTLFNEFRLGTARQYFPFQAYSFGQNWPQNWGFLQACRLPRSRRSATAHRVHYRNRRIRGALTWEFTDTRDARARQPLHQGRASSTGCSTATTTRPPRLRASSLSRRASPAIRSRRAEPEAAYADFMLGDVSSAASPLTSANRRKAMRCRALFRMTGASRSG